MTELLQYVTSGFWVFIGSLIFVCGGIMCFGWAMNAMFIGMKGKKCDNPEIL